MNSLTDRRYEGAEVDTALETVRNDERGFPNLTGERLGHDALDLRQNIPGGLGKFWITARGRIWSGSRLRRMSPAEWLAAGLLLAGIVVFAHWQRSGDLDARASIVRALLERPQGAELSDIHPLSKSARTSPSVAAAVRLSAAEMEAYVSGFGKPLWVRSVPSFGDTPLLPISPGNITWRSLPVPASVGDSGVAWSSLSAPAVSGVRNGRTLCIALQPRPTERGEIDGFAPTRRFTARDRTDVPRTDGRPTIVLGALDLETRTIHVQIN